MTKQWPVRNLTIFLICLQLTWLAASPIQVNQLRPNFSLPDKQAALFTRFEAGFSKFSRWFLKMLIKHRRRIRPATAKALREPLQLFLHNVQSNSLRDYRRFLQKKRSRGAKGPYYLFTNNNHFYYSILPIKYRRFAAAGFNMTGRIMLINPNYNPDSIFDNLVVFHEMVHALQDSTLRNHLAAKGKQGRIILKQYIRSLQSRIKDPDLEPVAYAMELELLNILLLGKLRRIIQKRQRLPVRQLIKLLGISSRSKLGSLRILLKYGQYYFREGCRIYAYTRRYRAVILRDHMRVGQRFTASENRFIKGYRRSTPPRSFK